MEVGKIIIIVAPSGTGKSTLIAKLKERFPLLKESVSYTTRSPREGEVDGVDYFFTTPEEFLKKREKNDFVEWAEVHGNFYGTDINVINKGLESGDALLFDLDVQGVDSFKRIYGKSAQAVFIAPPSLDALEQRLKGRGSETDQSLQTRLKNAAMEMKRKDDYDFLVINNEFDTALKDLEVLFSQLLGEA